MGKKIFFYIGTTAELVKLAPVIQECKKRKLDIDIITSGQSVIHFDEFSYMLGNVSASYTFAKKSDQSSVFFFLIWAIRTLIASIVRLRTVLLKQENTILIVHGDTVSSLIGALVAYTYKIPLAHIESGLRSFNFLEPFPEEICRYIISRIAAVHFCPNEWAVQNLSKTKGIKINTQQNTLIETFHSSRSYTSRHPFVQQMKKKKYFVLVLHRQEHVIFGKEHSHQLLSYIFQHVKKDISCAFMVHDLAKYFIASIVDVLPDTKQKNIYKVDRLPYRDFMKLLLHAEFLITDGGSNQEEIFYMGKPCLLLRNRTERIEGLQQNIVISKNNTKLIESFFHNYMVYKRKPIMKHNYPSRIICDYLEGDLP